MDELQVSYRATKSLLNKSRKPYADRKALLQATIAEKIEREEDCDAEKEELLIISEQVSLYNRMLSDVQLAIDWLRLGHNPGPRRGIHRMSLDQLTIPVDPLRMQSYAQPEACGSPTTITDSERYQIDDALSTLSKREKQCYVLKYGMCYSMQQIAEELNISKGTVQEYVEKAEQKVKDSVQNSLFLFCG